jgi:hypothetical protein
MLVGFSVFAHMNSLQCVWRRERERKKEREREKER